MMENKTAVEWLYQRILANDIKAVYEKALEIEKQQIEKVFVDVTMATLQNLGIKSTLQDVIDFKKIAEVYYNEEFKSK